MKKAYKWTAVAVLSTILIITLLVTKPNTPSIEEVPSTPNLEDVFVEQSGSQEDVEKINATTFPKLGLLSPFSPSGYLQCVGGSGKDSLKNVWQAEGFVFAVGETTSYDYDFYSAKGNVFIAKLDQIGRLLKVAIPQKSTALLDSQVLSQTLILLTQNSDSSMLSIYDSELNMYRSIPLPACDEGYLVFKESHIYVLLKEDLSFCIKKYTLDLVFVKDAGYSFPSSITIADFSFIDSTLSILVNCGISYYSCSFNSDLSLNYQKKLSYLENTTIISCLPSFFSKEIGYTILYKDSKNKLFVLGITLECEFQWVSSIDTAEHGAIVRTISGRYIVFTKTNSSSSAHILCSHGDVIERNIPSLSGSFPVEYTYSGENLILLTESTAEKKGAIVLVDKNDSPSLGFAIPSCSPKSFCISSDGQITVGVDTSSYSAPFGSGRGELSCFLLGLKG